MISLQMLHLFCTFLVFFFMYDVKCYAPKHSLLRIFWSINITASDLFIQTLANSYDTVINVKISAFNLLLAD